MPRPAAGMTALRTIGLRPITHGPTLDDPARSPHDERGRRGSRAGGGEGRPPGPRSGLAVRPARVGPTRCRATRSPRRRTPLPRRPARHYRATCRCPRSRAPDPLMARRWAAGHGIVVPRIRGRPLDWVLLEASSTLVPGPMGIRRADRRGPSTPCWPRSGRHAHPRPCCRSQRTPARPGRRLLRPGPGCGALRGRPAVRRSSSCSSTTRSSTRSQSSHTTAGCDAAAHSRRRRRSSASDGPVRTPADRPPEPPRGRPERRRTARRGRPPRRSNAPSTRADRSPRRCPRTW